MSLTSSRNVVPPQRGYPDDDRADIDGSSLHARRSPPPPPLVADGDDDDDKSVATLFSLGASTVLHSNVTETGRRLGQMRSCLAHRSSIMADNNNNNNSMNANIAALETEYDELFLLITDLQRLRIQTYRNAPVPEGFTLEEELEVHVATMRAWIRNALEIGEVNIPGHAPGENESLSSLSSGGANNNNRARRVGMAAIVSLSSASNEAAAGNRAGVARAEDPMEMDDTDGDEAKTDREEKSEEGDGDDTS